MSRIESLSENIEPQPGNPLAKIIEQKIQGRGPIPFDEYMNVWAHGAKDEKGVFRSGFYSNEASVISDMRIRGAEVDFQTQPERTPMFGYVLANQIAEMWEAMGFPDDFRIVEMGAGNGTMANDILHRLQEISEEKGHHKNIYDALRYVIVEQSGALLDKQQQKLEKFEGKTDFVRGSAVGLPLAGITGVVITNELLDAFPMKRARLTNSSLEECFIESGDDGRFKEIWKEPSDEVKKYVDRYGGPSDGKPFPVSLEGKKWMENIVRMLDRGFVVTMDYPFVNRFPALFGAKNKGLDTNSPDSHLQKKNIGNVDITGGVDFQMLSDVGAENGFRTEGYVNNTGFLYSLGIDLQLRRLLMLGRKEFAGRVLVEGDMEFAYESENYYVLVQSKGIEETVKFASLSSNFSRDWNPRSEFKGIRY